MTSGGGGEELLTPERFGHPPNEVIVINADGTGATTVIATKDHKRNISWLPTSGD